MYNSKLVVSVKCKGKVMREQGDTIFLPFGEEYSLLIKNLNTKKALVKVEIDGKVVIDGLIAHPNIPIDLERYVLDGKLDKGPRFKFIEKTSEISNHRGDRIDDGLIRVTYQYEQSPPKITYSDDYWKHPDIWHDPVLWCQYKDSGNPPPISCNYQASSFDSGNIKETTFTGAGGHSILRSNDGITTMGSESSQTFTEGHIGSLESMVHVIILQLKGAVEDHKISTPLTVSKKVKCDVCGKSNKSSSTFCSSCGTNLTYQY